MIYAKRHEILLCLADARDAVARYPEHESVTLLLDVASAILFDGALTDKNRTKGAVKYIRAADDVFSSLKEPVDKKIHTATEILEYDKQKFDPAIDSLYKAWYDLSRISWEISTDITKIQYKLKEKGGYHVPEVRQDIIAVQNKLIDSNKKSQSIAAYVDVAIDFVSENY